MNKRQLKQKYDAYVRLYNQKLKEGFEFDKDQYKDYYGDKKWERAYKDSLTASKGKQKSGYVLEPMLSITEFETLERNHLETGRSAPRVEEYVKAQTVKLTGAEKVATRAALDRLEENWDKIDTTAMPAELQDSINAYFNMNNEQKKRFLDSPTGEVWRAWVFEAFGNFGAYFNMNSPKDEVWEI